MLRIGLVLVVALLAVAPASAQQGPAYLDNRSTPAGVMSSLVDAINRREYARAYSYWEPNSPGLPAYADFEAGYASTTAVELVTGPVQSDAGAGQLYYSIAVTLRSRLVDGTAQSFVGCYVLHLAQPAIQTPPFRPLAIQSATVRQVPNDADHTALMNQACASVGVTGPGQSASRPAAMCASAVGCQYLEHTPLGTHYRFQSLNVCGANCSAQYWISSTDTGQQVLEIGPVRGGALVAVRPAEGDSTHAAVRVMQPSYAPNDPGCCPSGFTDTTYAWDAASGTLISTQASTTPSADFAGWDAARQQWQAEGWALVNV